MRNDLINVGSLRIVANLIPVGELWSASTLFRGERFEVVAASPEEAKEALLVALRSELTKSANDP